MAGLIRSFHRETDAFRQVIAECPQDRFFYVYVRKSNQAAESASANYLHAQLDLSQALAQAGVPAERMVVLSDDTGKSGTLSRQFRRDLARVFEDMGKGLVGTVVAMDVARLFRDYTDKEPAAFAARMARCGVHVVTHYRGQWRLLNMAKDADNQAFRDMAREAAHERLAIRDRCMTARERVVAEGGYGGRPVPIGWAVKPKTPRSLSPDGIERPGYMYVYEPHAAIKLEIMRLSLEPHICSFRQLRNEIIARGLQFPPFEESIRADCFPRSVICRCKTEEGGVIRPLRANDPFYPSLAMLKGILYEPLAIGHWLYGSGKYGESKLRRLRRIYEDQQDQRLDSLIRPYREFLGIHEDLTICRTPEQIELFFKVCEKWCESDVRTLHETGYEVKESNPHCIRRVGRPRGTGPKYSNPWSNRVFCLKHVHDPNEYYIRRAGGPRGEWACSKDYSTGNQPYSCSTWGEEDRLGRILDYHLLYHLSAMLMQDGSLLGNLVEERRRLVARIEDMRREISELESERDRQLRRQDELERRLEGMEESFMRQEIDGFFERNVKPIMAALQARRKELRQAEEEGTADLMERTEEELREELWSIVRSSQIPEAKRHELISTFVERVGVFIPQYTGNVLIEFRWSKAVLNGRGERVVDTLIGWKNLSKDFREWTPEEDAALRELYPVASGASYDEIRERLQPCRKIDAIVKRVRQLGICREGRTESWINACRLQDKTWGQGHPEVFYLYLADTPLEWLRHADEYHPSEGEPVFRYPCSVMVEGEGEREEIDLPDQIRETLLFPETSESL
jgi:DNA invertase Pin-like site-specific DNA recombinase